jgi:hypothetical protein
LRLDKAIWLYGVFAMPYFPVAFGDPAVSMLLKQMQFKSILNGIFINNYNQAK